MAFKVDISAKNMEVTERINNYINTKITRLDRHLNNIEDTRVDLAYIKSARNSSDRQVAQITIRGRGYILRVEERADDIFAAFDAALDKMSRQVERLKGKRIRGRGDGTPASEVAPEAAEVEETPPQPTIVRRKQFTLHPMDEQEALEQMVLLGHENFFIFYNANTSSMNVLYRRRDGTYGLIDPKVG
ncbi:MAG: ribosome-associated translation inhibitor RaiA [Anaerolineaceae bacterium]|jgi:putative sigma-54 modulation protein